MGMGGGTQSWPMEANSGVRGRVRAAEKAPEGMTDRQTHRHTHTIRPLYDDLFASPTKWLLAATKAQYTPPTPTRRNCRVASRRVGVGNVYMNSQLTHDDCRRIR